MGQITLDLVPLPALRGPLPAPALAACYRNTALDEAAKQVAEFGQQRSLPPSWCVGLAYGKMRIHRLTAGRVHGRWDDFLP